MANAENWILDCLTILQFMQGGQEWSRGLVAIYTLVLKSLGDEWARKAVEFAVLNEKWRPAPAELRHIAAKLASPFPAVDDAYAEMLEHAERGGIYSRPDPTNPNVFLEGPPVFSHPLIAQAVRACGGWRMICSGESQMQEGLSKQFRGAYERAATQWLADVSNALALPASERPARLFPKPAAPKPIAPKRKIKAALPPARPDLPAIAPPPDIREKLQKATGGLIGRSLEPAALTEEEIAQRAAIRREMDARAGTADAQLHAARQAAGKQVKNGAEA